jgi:hypothetical protein
MQRGEVSNEVIDFGKHNLDWMVDIFLDGSNEITKEKGGIMELEKEKSRSIYYPRSQCTRGEGCGHCNLTAREQRMVKSFVPAKGPYNYRWIYGGKVFHE